MIKQGCLLLLAWICIQSVAWADCMERGIYAFPLQQKISTESIFMLEGYAASQSVIQNLNTKYPVYLESKEHRIALEVVETYEGMFRLSQVILRPAETLVSGETYQLKIDSLKGEQQYDLTRWNEWTESLEAISWTAYNDIEVDVSHWIRPAKLESSHHVQHLGHRGTETVLFSLRIRDESQTLIKTEWIDTITGDKKTYYLLAMEHEIQVGHGMCSGAFVHEEQHRYKVRFQLVNAVGDAIEWSEWQAYDFG